MAEAMQDPDSPLSQYEVIKPIGKGKFAIVYRARRKPDSELVAIKRISVNMMDLKARDKCLKEVRVLQNLDHPNIIRYLESFIHDNDLYIVFEWAAAGDLKRQLRKAQEKGTQFSERIVWKYFAQICDAMQHMHERRIMHRDLKPANIFLTTDSTIKVGDLGLSREMSDETMQAFSKVGTPLYMSPEVLKGDGYDFKSDIWSMGCLLYELAMLKSPFKSEGLNLYLLFQKISRAEYQPVSEEYSVELRDLVVEMLNTTAGNRPDINYVCEIARRMRDRTTQEYLRQKRSMRQDSGKDADGGDSRPAPTTTPTAGPTSSPPTTLPTTTTPTKATTLQSGSLAPNRVQQNGLHVPSQISDRASERNRKRQPSSDHQPQTADVHTIAADAGEEAAVSADQFQAMYEMDALYDMLQALGYSSAASIPGTELPPVNSLYFVFEAQAYSTPFRPQLHNVVKVACWLFRKCDAPHLCRFDDVATEPPITIARQLLACAQQLVDRPEKFARVNVSAVARGHGAAVCTLLKELALVAMERNILRPIRRVDEVVDDDIGGPPEDGDYDGDSIATDSEAEESSPHQLGYQVSQAENSHMLSYVAPHSDGQRWCQETDAVASRLARRRKDLTAMTLGGWESHHSSFRMCTEELQCYTSVPATHDQAWLPQALQSLSADCATAVSACDGAEHAILRQNNLKAIQNDFQRAAQVIAELTQKQEDMSGLVARCVQQLDEVTGRVDDLQHNTCSLLKAGSDAHQLVTLKASISELQSEIKALDISAATTSHRLIAYRLLTQEQARKLRRVRLKQSNRPRPQSKDDDDQFL